MKHNIKIQQCFFDRIHSGEKTFEIRKNDRDYQVGDYIDFEVIFVKLFNVLPPHYKKTLFKITYLTVFEQKEGYCVFALEGILDEEKEGEG